MTTIVLKGNIIASDSMCTYGSEVFSNNVKKIHTVGDYTFALAGSYHHIEEVADVLKSEESFKEALSVIKESLDEETTILLHTGEVWYEIIKGCYFQIPQDTLESGYAIGSGGVFARSAMALGANAIQAVIHASSLDLYTNNRVKFKEIK